MNVIGLTISINYGDYLGVTLKHNRSLFDRYYIGTIKQDTVTIDVAKQYDTEVLYYDELLTLNGSKFNKSGIMHQMQIMAHTKHQHHWMLVHDSDCLIHLDKTEIEDDSKLYGVNRINFPTFEDYKSNKSYRYYQHGHGYFQLYFQKNYIYDYWSLDCGFCDVGFKSLWKKNYQCLQNSAVEHLGPAFVNWQGRKTPTWG
jgi:hypothetical protein